MDKNTHRVRFANYIPVAISMIAKEVIRKRWLTDNPAKGIERSTYQRIAGNHISPGRISQSRNGEPRRGRWNV